MKMNKKLMALLLTVCLGTAMLAGCGDDSNNRSSETNSQATTQPSNDNTPSSQEESEESETPEIDISEHVVLTMYCIGDEGGIYAQDHLDKLNELLTEKINAELEPIMVSWGDYKTKLPMVWASGETYDLTYTANWVSYFQEAAKGAFMDITELLPTYAPKTYAELVEKDMLETTKVNGNLYMVPATIPDYTTFVWCYREDLRKKYNCPEIVDMETLETYFQAIKDNEPEMFAFANNGGEAKFWQTWLNEMDWARPVEYGNAGVFTYDLLDPTHVFNVVETPEYEEFVKKCRNYYEKGYWSQSLMADNTSSNDNFLAGKSGSSPNNFSNINGAYQKFATSNPDWELGIFSSDMLSGTVERISASNNGTAIGAYSKNPERAMMFIELCHSDREVYDVLMNGLEGVTFEADREAGVKWIPEGTDVTTISLKNLGMGFGTQEFYLGSLNDSPDADELKAEYDKIAVFPGLSGFTIDSTDIAADLAALKSICDEYKIPLEKGVVDPEEGLAELRSKLKDAGVDKVLEELNKQIADYLAQQ